MRIVATILAFSPMAACPAVADCDLGAVSRLMRSGLPAKADIELEATKAESADGGSWEIYLGPDGRTPRNIVRTDFGETGRIEHELLIAGPGLHALTRTHISYSVPYAVQGSSVVKEVKEVFTYCDGDLVLPPRDIAAMDDYEQAAGEVGQVFDAPEIAEHVAGLKR